MTADLPALIARLEAATGPDGALDIAIACCMQTVIQECCGRGVPVWRGGNLVEQECCGCPNLLADHAFTASLDAALTLVPEGMFWVIGAGKVRPKEPLYGAQIRRPFPDSEDVVGEGESDATAAIALCIAALKARTP